VNRSSMIYSDLTPTGSPGGTDRRTVGAPTIAPSTMATHTVAAA